MRIGTGDPWALTELAKAGGLGGGGGVVGVPIYGILYMVWCLASYAGLITAAFSFIVYQLPGL